MKSLFLFCLMFLIGCSEYQKAKVTPVSSMFSEIEVDYSTIDLNYEKTATSIAMCMDSTIECSISISGDEIIQIVESDTVVSKIYFYEIDDLDIDKFYIINRIEKQNSYIVMSFLNMNRRIVSFVMLPMIDSKEFYLYQLYDTSEKCYLSSKYKYANIALDRIELNWFYKTMELK
jgi:hypothetical protein